MMKIEKLNYFGTDTKSPGHYFFRIGNFQNPDRSIGNGLTFNPEGLVSGIKNGRMNIVTINGLNIIAIAGSPIDERGGCKSVFWAEKETSFKDLKEAILTLPASKKIIDMMPFEIHWPF
jgi:hypothetical protein